MLQFSIRGLLLISVPVAFGCLWFADYYRDRAPIQWREFSVEEMDAELSAGNKVLVIGLPQFLPSMSTNALLQCETADIKRHCDDVGYATMKLEYMPWAPVPDNIREEMDWFLHQTSYRYKEPSLLAVSPDGTVNVLTNIFYGVKAADFFNEQPVPRLHRRNLYLIGAIVSLFIVAWVNRRQARIRSSSSN